MAVIRNKTRGVDDDTKAIIAVVATAAVIAATLMAAPGIVGALISGLGLTSRDAGLAIGIEQACMALAALPALWWMRVFNWGATVRWCLVAVAIGDLASASVHHPAALIALRGLSGLAEGSVMAVCLAVVGRSTQQERNFALWATGQLIVGAIILSLLPRVPVAIRAPVVFGSLAVLIVLLLPMSPWLARSTVLSAQVRTRNALLDTAALSALGAVLTFYLAIGGVWTYVERIGLQDGLPAPVVASDLAIASLFGIAGCLTAVWLKAHIGRAAPLCVGYGILLAATWMLSRPATPFAFATSTFAFLYAWTFSLPFLLAVVASLDRTGRLSVLINLMIGAGLGFGPVIFAAMLKVPPDYRIAIPMAIVAGTVSLCLALAADRLPNREFPNETAG
jgi:hypothetical protein